MMPPNEETQRMTLEWCRSSPRELVGIIQSVDTKLIDILAAASVIIGITTALGGTMDAITWGLAAAPFGVAVLAYLLIFGLVLRQLRPKDVEGPDDPRKTEGYWSLSPIDAITHHWELLGNAYKKNSGVLKAKTRAVEWCVWFLAIEVVALVLWLAVAT